MKMIFSETDYRPLNEDETYEDKFVILNPKLFKPEYQEAKCQLYYAMAGFGCDPTKRGGKIFGKLFDEDYQTRREYVLGVATEEAIKEWEETYGISREVFYEAV